MTLQERVTLALQSVGADVKAILGKIGNLTTLTTTAKGDVVSAINEIAENTTTNAVGDQFEIVDGEFRIKDSYLIAFGTAQGWGAGVPTPVASSVAFTGTQTQGQTLTGTYTYSGGTEGSSLPKWYRSDNASGLNRAAISGATASTYVLQAGDVGKYIQFAVTPVSNTPTTGTEVFSAYSGAIVASAGGLVDITGWTGTNVTVASNDLSPTSSANSFARVDKHIVAGTSGIFEGVSNGATLCLYNVYNDTNSNNQRPDNQMLHAIRRDSGNGKIICITSGSYFSDDITGRPSTTKIRLRGDGTNINYEYSVNGTYSDVILLKTAPQVGNLFPKYFAFDLSHFLNDTKGENLV